MSRAVRAAVATSRRTRMPPTTHTTPAASPTAVAMEFPSISGANGRHPHNHALELEELAAALNLPGPLTPAQVTEARQRFGPNTISSGRSASWYSLLFSAAFHPFNVLLGILATATGLNDDYDGMGVMIFMIVVSMTIRFVQEFKSARAAESLKALVTNTAHVLRYLNAAPGGEAQIHTREILVEELVPGDWVQLTAGCLVPADVVLTLSKDLLVSQASLTGEAIPVEKYYGGGGVHTQGRIPRSVGSQISLSLSGSHDDDVRLLQSEPRAHRLRHRCANFFRALFGIPIHDNRSQDGGGAGSVHADLDNPNLCYMGTAVVSGTGTALVRATGRRTYFGSMADQLAKAAPQNAFQLGVRRISWIFFLSMLALVPPVLLLQGLVNGDWRAAFLFSLAVAVGLTPEMLPMIVSATLARGAYIMSRKKCIVKNMDSIINLGGMDVLCTDKTGTLTEACVALITHVDLQGHPATLPLQLGFLNSWHQTGLKNVMDEAVTAFFQEKVGAEVSARFANGFRKLDEIPFDFLRRRMSVLLQCDVSYFLVSKGAVDEMLSMCSTAWVGPSAGGAVFSEMESEFTLPTESECEPMTDELRAGLQKLNAGFNDNGLRVLAVAFKTLPLEAATGYAKETQGLPKSQEMDMTFAGFLAFQDPPKQSTAPAIKTLLESNICVKVLTGDSAAVCRKICQDIQLPIRRIVTATELEGASEAEVAQMAEEGTIFAKLTPLQKADIVRALQRAGHVVGFLGDGINDAPALVEADIGLSVDNGTDIARDSANIILLEKDLGVVADGVIEGRTTYGNTMKYIVMAISSNFGNVFSVVVASAWLPFLPMLPIHILAQNLLYDTSQIAIPWDHMDKQFLAVPHRWSMKSVLTFMVFLGPWSSVFDICTFSYMYFYYGIKSPADNVPLFQTTWFTVGILTQTLIVHMIRTPLIPFVQSMASAPVVVMTAVIMGIGLALPYIPFVSTYLAFVHVDLGIYPFVALMLFLYCTITQAAKIVYIKIFKKWY